MRRVGTTFAFVLLLAAAAIAQPPPPPRLTEVPVGGNGYFGAPLDDQFTPQNVFKGVPPPPKPDPPEKLEEALFPPKPPQPKIWSGLAEFGVNGASGNSDLFSLRGAWNAQRKTADNLLVCDFWYAYLQQDGNTNQQQALLNARDEILFPGYKWSLFTATQVEYDELRDYRFRVGIYAGTGYTLVESKETLFRIRAGAGAQRELGFGGPKNQWVPEADWGYDFRYRMNARNAFVSVLDYYPRLDDWSVFRVRFRAAYELILDFDTGTVIRFGIQERYDSNSGNSQPNDLTYFTTLGLKF